MPALPSGFKPTQASNFQRFRSVRTDYAEDGTVRFVDFTSHSYADFSLVFEGLTSSERDTLVGFLDTNQTADIDVVINSTTYRGHITTAPSWVATTGLYSVSFNYRAKPL